MADASTILRHTLWFARSVTQVNSPMRLFAHLPKIKILSRLSPQLRMFATFPLRSLKTYFFKTNQGRY